MKVEQAENRLRQLLVDSGFALDKPDPSSGWQVFKQFVQEPVEDADDGVLFEIGIYTFTGVEQCHFGLVRQFSINDSDGEYHHMEQLHFLFLCDPTDRLRQFKTNRWAYDAPSMKDRPEQAPGYLPESRPERRRYGVSSPERAENAKTGNAASCGELHPRRLKIYFAEVESMEAFQAAMTHEPWRCEIAQWVV